MIYLDSSVALAHLLVEERRPPASVWADMVISSRLLEYEVWSRLHVVFEASFGEEPWGTRAVGKAAARQLIEKMIELVPDIRWDEIRHFVCPEHAAVESVTTGSPRDGKRFEVHLVDVLTLRYGKIAAKRSYRKGRL